VDETQGAAAGEQETEVVFLDEVEEDEEVLGTLPDPDAPPPAAAGRRRRVAGLVLAVLAAGALLAYHYRGTPLPGPEAVVAAYFQDLSTGDAQDAQALATGPYQGTPVLVAQTLADPADRPSGLSIVSSRPLAANLVAQDRGAGVTERALTVVSVKYDLQDAGLNDTFLAGQDPRSGQWRLVNPYRLLNVGGGWSARVTVDGVSVPESRWIAVFPGAHVVAEPASPDFAPASVTTFPIGADPGELFTQAGFGQVTLPQPALSSRGRAAVQAAYRGALETCAAQADTGFGVCGLDDTYAGYTCRTLSWTITGVATARLELDEENADGSFPLVAGGSTAAESGGYTDSAGAARTFQNQPAHLEDSFGTIVFRADGSAAVTLTE
jgi:hypothetical protein